MIRVLLMVALVLGEWNVAVPDYEWSFPRDHWAHDGYRTEWWYVTGHLAADGERDARFGYQFTFFRIGVLTEAPNLDSGWATSHLLMGHAAVTDLESGRHVFSEVLYREIPLLASFGRYPAARIASSLGPAGTETPWTLDWNGEAFDFEAHDTRAGFGFKLETRPTKPPVFQGANGFSRKGEGEGAASQYYSFTRLDTEGELELDGKRYAVTGESWMDKEFSSSQLEDRQVGWDWFSLQLDDGRELMLYLMRRADGSVDYASATLVSASGNATYLPKDAFEVNPVARWTSPETGAVYPSEWNVTLRSGETFVLRALLEDQENRSRLPGGVYYWEGMVSVTGPDGEPLGRGFVELTGYGDGNRPPV